MTLELIRLGKTPLTPTFGVLREGMVPFAVTLERPWLDNRKGESCIPDGTFVCRRVHSPKFGVTFEVIVPGRDAILFHCGNLMSDSHGCIILGEQFEPLIGQAGVAVSKKAFAEFLDRTKLVDEFYLVVRTV